MSDDATGFTLPPFDAALALAQLKRALRDLKLTERGPSFEWHGKSVLRLAEDGTSIAAQLAKRPMLTPEWDRLRVASAADQRKLLDELKRRLDRWQRED